MNQFPKDNAALAKLLRTMNQVPKGNALLSFSTPLSTLYFNLILATCEESPLY